MTKFIVLSLFLGSLFTISEAVPGKATYYYVSASITACGTRHSDSELVAAIGRPYWTTPNPNNDPLCLNQQKATVTDPSSGKNVTVLIRDICGSCAQNNIDLSPGAFQQLRPLSVGMFDVNWEFVDGGGDGICRGRVVADGGLNIRERPDASSPIVEKVANGIVTQIWWRTTGSVVNGNPNWFQVPTGYASAYYVVISSNNGESWCSQN